MTIYHYLTLNNFSTPTDMMLQLHLKILIISVTLISFTTTTYPPKLPKINIDNSVISKYTSTSKSQSNIVESSTCGKYCKVCDTNSLKCKLCASGAYLVEGSACHIIPTDQKIDNCKFYADSVNCLACNSGYYLQNNKCIPCSLKDKKLVTCFDNNHSSCIPGYIFEVNISTNKLNDLFDHKKVFESKDTKCRIIKSDEEKNIGIENCKFSITNSNNLRICRKCITGYSKDGEGCRKIVEPNCTVYDFHAKKCQTCSSGYRVRNSINHSVSNNVFENSISKVHIIIPKPDSIAMAESDLLTNQRKSKKIKIEKDKNRIGLRIFNPEKIEDKIKSNVYKQDDGPDCVQCPEGCSICRSGTSRQVALDERKFIDNRCIMCKNSQAHEWPKRFHTITGQCLWYAWKNYNKGYESIEEIESLLGYEEWDLMRIYTYEHNLLSANKSSKNPYNNIDDKAKKLKSIKTNKKVKVASEAYVSFFWYKIKGL